MGRLIAKFGDKYLEWSSVVDAPVTMLMTRDELEEYVLEEYGREGLRDLPARLERADKNGTSSLDGSTIESLLYVNRAGPKERKLSLAQLIKRYTPKPEPAKKTRGKASPKRSESKEGNG